MGILNKSIFSISPVGSHTRIASVTSATTITIPQNASGIIMQASAANVFYTIDGSTPTTATRFILNSSGSPTRIDLYPGATIKVISPTGELNYQFFRVEV